MRRSLLLPLPWLVRRLLPAVEPRRQAALRVPALADFRRQPGVDISLDEENNTVTLSGYHPVKREIARRTLETLVRGLTGGQPAARGAVDRLADAERRVGAAEAEVSRLRDEIERMRGTG